MSYSVTNINIPFEKINNIKNPIEIHTLISGNRKINNFQRNFQIEDTEFVV